MKKIVSVGLLATMLFGCGEIRDRDSELMNEKLSPEVQNFLEGVVIAGTYGRSGAGGGVDRLVKRLKERLVPVGVPNENIYVQSWNLDSDNVPGTEPSTGRHGKRIKDLMGRKQKIAPEYLAMFGHSFGGWGTGRLSRQIQKDTGYIADRVYLFDPVVFNTYRFDDEQFEVVAKQAVNWYQDNAISGAEFNHCTPISSCSTTGDVSCGSKFDGAHNVLYNLQRRSDGSKIKKECTFGSTYRKHVHTTIDDDEYLHQIITDQIVDDIKSRIAAILNPPIGFYRLIGQNEVYLKYSSSNYCHVESENQMNAFGGFDKVKIVKENSSSFMRKLGAFTGRCGWPNGLYRRSNDAAVFYLYGQESVLKLASELCWVSTEEKLINSFGGYGSVVVVEPTADLIRGRRHNGICP